MPSATTRGVAGGLAVLYVLFLAFTVFWPSAEYATGTVDVATDFLHSLGAPGWITDSWMEFLANIVLFIPLSLLGSVLLDRWGWRFWLGAGFAASACIELAQLIFLGGRSPTLLDVLANTLGAVAGALIAVALRTRLPRS